MIKDVFICHASEEKVTVVRPIARALEQSSISFWLDEAEILWGDDITDKINEGLSTSRFLIVVLSDAFLTKRWPQQEFNATLSRELSSGKGRVLPLLVGDKSTQQAVLDKYPLIASRHYKVWDGDPRFIVEALQRRLQRGENASKPVPVQATPQESVYLPRHNQTPSQQEKDDFLEEVFAVIKQHFRQALKQAEQHYPQSTTKLEEITSRKFICTIYMQGAIKNRCKVWLGGLIGTDSINYHDGQIDINNDGQFSESLSVDRQSPELALQTLFAGLGGPPVAKTKGLSPKEAADLLWRRFVYPLENS